MIGGGGERKTLRLAAQYGDASNVFGGPTQIAHKWEVLRAHCEALGRPFDEIERSTLQGVRLPGTAPDRTETPAQGIVHQFVVTLLPGEFDPVGVGLLKLAGKD